MSRTKKIIAAVLIGLGLAAAGAAVTAEHPGPAVASSKVHYFG